MNDPDQRRPRSFRTLGVILGTVAVAGLAVVSFGSFAGADDTGGSATTAPDATARPHRQLTDTQKQCLADHRLALGQKPAEGSHDSFRAAAEACGLTIPAPGARPTI